MGDIVEFVGGGTPSKVNPEFWKGDIVWLSSQEIKKRYITSGTYTISENAVEKSSTKVVSKGTPLIVSRSGILARIFPISIPMVNVAINQDIKALIFNTQKFDTDFIVGFLESRENFILKSVVKTGTTVQSISMPDLKKMKFSYPSFVEQQTIGKDYKKIVDTIASNQLQQKSHESNTIRGP